MVEGVGADLAGLKGGPAPGGSVGKAPRLAGLKGEFWGGVRSLDASAPVRVEVRRPAGTEGSAYQLTR